jgi:hypothetical protein
LPPVKESYVKGISVSGISRINAKRIKHILACHRGKLPCQVYRDKQ